MRHREAERRAYIKKRVLPNIDGRVRLTTSHNGKTTELSRCRCSTAFMFVVDAPDKYAGVAESQLVRLHLDQHIMVMSVGQNVRACNVTVN